MYVTSWPNVSIKPNVSIMNYILALNYIQALNYMLYSSLAPSLARIGFISEGSFIIWSIQSISEISSN